MPADERAEIEAAMDRLLAGTPLRSDGKLTVVSLAAEAARRAGHGVAVLLKVYANCIDGQAGAANQRIDDALDDPDSE
jgi:hypothetical protein